MDDHLKERSQNPATALAATTPTVRQSTKCLTVRMHAYDLRLVLRRIRVIRFVQKREYHMEMRTRRRGTALFSCHAPSTACLFVRLPQDVPNP